MKNLTVGDRVRYSTKFLRSTGMYTGEIPFARGVITALEKVGSITLAVIDWHNPAIPERVSVFNLERVSQTP